MLLIIFDNVLKKKQEARNFRSRTKILFVYPCLFITLREGIVSFDQK